MDDAEIIRAMRSRDLAMRLAAGESGILNRDVVDPEQPGQSFWPASVEQHRVLLAQIEAELASALRTIQALHRCPHCDRPLAPLPSRSE